MTGGIFAVLDDIALLLDDAAVMSKVAVKKTAGILGDDLAVNAEKATGFRASRELPVLWAITKGSFLNKLIILPLAFLLSAYASWLIVPVLLLGGAYLSYEGIEKIYHVLTASHPTPPTEMTGGDKDFPAIERAKIKSAVRTDFILSIEIVMIALGTVMEYQLMLQIVVVSFVALVATVGVYGVVALIVRMDDVGFYLISRAEQMQGAVSKIVTWAGKILVASLPKVIHALGIIGTLAMLLVGGGMFTHNIESLHLLLNYMPSILTNLLVGSLVGGVLLLLSLVAQKIKEKI